MRLQIIFRIACIAIGYAFGLIQTGYIVGKTKGTDIREHGSGNAGTTNALRTFGWKSALVTLLGDCFKCFFAILLCRYLFGTRDPELYFLYGMYGGFGAILGHNFPFYLKFKGGKGIASTAGIYFSIGPVMTLIGAVSFGVIVGITRYVSLGSILVVIEMLVGVIVYGTMGKFALPQPALIELYILTAFMMVMAIWRHKANIKRLLSGTENKLGQKAK